MQHGELKVLLWMWKFPVAQEHLFPKAPAFTMSLPIWMENRDYQNVDRGYGWSEYEL
jgi:hypothetical protein